MTIKDNSFKIFHIGESLNLLSGFPFPSNKFSQSSGFPLIRIRDIKKSKIDTYFTGTILPLYIIKSGDILVGMDGDFNVIKWNNINALLNQRVLKISIKQTNELDLTFIYYWLQPYISHINTITAATTVKHLSIMDLKNAKGLIPNYERQKKIGLILQTIDEVIEKTEALIKKYELIKTGLMQDLLTRGIGSDGKLRPPREQAPELYQETEIGWIPKEWEDDLLENVLAPTEYNLRSGPFGSALLKEELVDSGIPLLGIDNIHIEEFSPNFRRFVTQKKFNELAKYSVKAKDVVITIMGTVGRSAIIPNNIEKALSSKHLWTITLNQCVVIPELVCWQLNFASWVKAWFRRETQGGIMDAIQSKTLKKLRIPLPSFDEQLLIAQKWKSINIKIRFEKEYLTKLKKQKQGLMHDLLTGKVPVIPDETEVSNV